MARTINPDKLRFALLMSLDFEQTDARLVRDAKQAVRKTDPEQLVAMFAAVEQNSAPFFDTIRDAYKASGADAADVTALCQLMAREGVL